MFFSLFHVASVEAPVGLQIPAVAEKKVIDETPDPLMIIENVRNRNKEGSYNNDFLY